MKGTLFKKILYRNLFLSVLSLVFTLSVGMFLLYQFTYNNFKNDNQRVANLVAQRIDNYMNLAIVRALYIAKDRHLVTGDPRPILEDSFRVSGVYDTICLYNNRGDILNYYPHKETINKKLLTSLLNRDFNYYLKNQDKHIIIFTPVKDAKGNVKMLLAFNIEKENSKFFNKLILQTKDNFGGSGYIIDENGEIIFHANKLQINNKLPLEAITSILHKNKREEGTNNLISAISKIPTTNWYTIVETPSQNVISPLLKFSLIITTVFILMFILYATISYFSLKRTLKPVKDLISEMTVFSELDYYQPLPVKGIGEVAYLYEAFNLMINRLKKAWELEQETFEELKRAEKLSVVGELAAGSAHEIRNPLTTIKGFIQLYYDSGQRITPDHKDLIFSELEKIEQITNEFLMLSKPQMNVYQNSLVQDLINQVCLIIEDDAMVNNVKIINQVKCACHVYCDVPQIRQVFINISRNAIQAMAKGGTLTIECKEDEINKGSYISFSDTGTGIPKENLDKIEEPFFTTKAYGTGLGLTVSYKIIQNHHGNININTSSMGTTFTIWLPQGNEQAVD